MIVQSSKPALIEHLPTPQISVVGVEDYSNWSQVDRISWKTYSRDDVMNTSYSNEYYNVLLDVYLNSFGLDRKWFELPDLKLELCRVTNKNQGGWGQSNPKNWNGSGYSNNAKIEGSQKDFGITQIVHSTNLPIGGTLGDTVLDTKYSGGGGGFDNNEWSFPDTNALVVNSTVALTNITFYITSLA